MRRRQLNQILKHTIIDLFRESSSSRFKEHTRYVGGNELRFLRDSYLKFFNCISNVFLLVVSRIVLTQKVTCSGFASSILVEKLRAP